MAGLRDKLKTMASLSEDWNAQAAAPEAPKTKTAIDDGNAPAIGKGERKYNLVNVIRAMVAAHEGKIGPDVGFEREVSDEIAKRSGKTGKGFYIPSSALLGARAFDKANAAAALVATDTLFGEFIEALVADTVLGAAGVRTLAGLVGDVTIPKSGSATAYWVATEGGNATETTPNIGQVGATPHTVGAYTDITRKLLMQSGIGAQTLIADLLREAIGRAIEAAVFSGSGASGQPLVSKISVTRKRVGSSLFPAPIDEISLVPALSHSTASRSFDFTVSIASTT